MSTTVLLPGCAREPAPARRGGADAASATANAAASAVGSAPLVVAARLAPSEARAPSFDGGPMEFIRTEHAELFPLFCVYRTLGQGERSGLWTQKYQGRWVRWTGKLKSFTQNGITVQMRPETVTFDLSLFLEDKSPALQSRFKPGDRVTFIGRLDNYDDIFQTLYLSHGAVIDPPDKAPDWMKL